MLRSFTTTKQKQTKIYMPRIVRIKESPRENHSLSSSKPDKNNNRELKFTKFNRCILKSHKNQLQVTNTKPINSAPKYY